MTWALLAALGCTGCGGGFDPVGNPDTARDDTAPDTGGDTGDSTVDSDSSPEVDSCDENGSLGDGPDADGDGFVATAEGGDDCDDTRDNVYPGAPDPCDDLDQDCDGEPMPEGSCGEAGDVAEAAWVVIEGDADVSLVHLASPSWHGDGPAWLGVLGVDVEHNAKSRWGLFEGSTLGDQPRPAVEGWSGTWGEALGAIFPIGDADGDGTADAWAEWQSGSSAYGAYLLLPGPVLGARCTLDEVHQRSTVSVTNSTVAGSGLYMLDAGFDADGDGLSDARASLHPESGPVREYLLDGATVATIDGEVELAAAFSHATRDEDDGFAYWPQAVPDVDGDGADDLVVLHDCGAVTTNGGVAVISGVDFVAAAVAGGALIDSAFLVCSRGEASDWSVPSLWNAPDRAADVNGDGHPDLVLGGEAVEEEDGFVAFVDLTNLDDAPMEDRVLIEVAGASSNASGAATNIRGTHFGPDISSQWLVLGDRRGYCLFGVFDFALGGVTDYQSLAAPCFEYPGSWDTVLRELVDLDGDSFPEWLFEDSQEKLDGIDIGRVTIVHGFEPPYDDPTRW